MRWEPIARYRIAKGFFISLRINERFGHEAKQKRARATNNFSTHKVK